jgi:hypothetical protein
MSPVECITRMTVAMKDVVSGFPARLNDWLATLPSTNARIAMTLLCVLITCGRFVWKGAPADGWVAWLAFLITMSGLDATQFYAKRVTHRPNGAASPPPTSGDPS